MSVREVNVNEKTIGLRVERSIDKVLSIKFFSYRIRVLKNGVTTYRNATRAEKKELLAAAETYDKKLERLQKKSKAQQGFDPFVSRTNTGIKGISYRAGKDTQGYEYVGFFINITVDGKQHSSSVRMADRSWEENWRLAALRLAKVKKLDRATTKRIILAIPSEKKLRGRKAK